MAARWLGNCCDPNPHSRRSEPAPAIPATRRQAVDTRTDRKSTRLNSSHLGISYAVFCLKKNTLTVFAIQRGDKAGIRLKHNNSRLRKEFTGLDYFTIRQPPRSPLFPFPAI